MSSPTAVDSPPAGEPTTTNASAAVNSPATPAAVTSTNGDTPITPAAVTSPETGEDLTKSDPNGRPEKKQKLDSDDHRRERGEWSASAITILLDSFTEKYIALNRSNLRRKEWEVVANLVAEGCDKQNRKSIEQCKNKVDNLKKVYKLETQRMESDEGSVSNWIWFKKMDYLFGAAAAAATVSEAVSDDDKSAGVSSANKLQPSTSFRF